MITGGPNSEHVDIYWGLSIWYNALRCICAVSVWVVIIIISTWDMPDRSYRAILCWPLVAPVSYYMFFLPAIFAMEVMMPFVPPLGLAALLLTIITTTMGDPLVFVLKRLFPWVVPVDQPALVSLQPFLKIRQPPRTSP